MTEMAKCERKLLLFTGLLAINGVLVVSLAKDSINYSILLALLGLMIIGIVVQLTLRTISPGGDPFLLPLSATLAVIGLTMVLRLKPALFLFQAIWVTVGLLVFLLTVYFSRRLDRLAQYKYVCGLVGVILLLTAILFGVDIGGHKSWVVFGPVRFQPSEFAKLFIVLFLAAYLNERQEVLSLATKSYGPFVFPQPRFIAPLLAVWGMAMAMFVIQRDMGSALLYFGVTIVMAYMASGRLNYIVIGVVLFFIGSLLCYKLYSHIQVRVDIWLNPWEDPNGKAYQIVQSLFALGSGGVLGSGLTYGFPEMIPEVHTDFIFAAIGEELGLMGAGGVLVIYILLVYRAFRAALLAVSSFSSLVAGGMAVVMALQIFLIIGGVTKFFPLTGITLPWVSYGGSSIVSNFILLGMLFSISEERPIDT